MLHVERAGGSAGVTADGGHVRQVAAQQRQQVRPHPGRHPRQVRRQPRRQRLLRCARVGAGVGVGGLVEQGGHVEERPPAVQVVAGVQDESVLVRLRRP